MMDHGKPCTVQVARNVLTVRHLGFSEYMRHFQTFSKAFVAFEDTLGPGIRVLRQYVSTCPSSAYYHRANDAIVPGRPSRSSAHLICDDEQMR